jgi:hypothetical protein
LAAPTTARWGCSSSAAAARPSIFSPLPADGATMVDVWALLDTVSPPILRISRSLEVDGIFPWAMTLPLRGKKLYPSPPGDG